MLPAVILALFAYSFCKIEIQCSVIRREIPVLEARDSTELTKNLTLLKKIEDVVIRSKTLKKMNMSTRKNQLPIDLDRADIPTMPLLEKESPILIPTGQNLLPKDNAGRRKPKFLAPLAFLTGLGAGSLATAASVNANAFVRIFSPAVPVPIGPPGYFTGYYEPQQYLPFPYPVLYPVPRFANNYENFVSGIPVIPSPSPQKNIANVSAEKSEHKNDTNLVTTQKAIERPANEEAQESSREAATTEADVKRTVFSDVDDDNIESPAMNEETELRQAVNQPQTTTTSSTTTTTIKPETMNTSLPSNITVPLTSWINTTGSWPFYGYYRGSPQDVGHLILTTEDPQQRYLKNYHGDGFALPFERPAVYNPYQNAESYPSSFVNSFSSGEPYPDFLNTIESDRYVYDSENHRNFNGFRPILK